MLHYSFSGPTFIEWEVTGHDKIEHVSDLLKAIFPNSTLAKEVANYQWQLFFALEHCNEQQKKLYQILKLLVKDILLNSLKISIQDSTNQLYLVDKEKSTVPSKVSNTSGYHPIRNNHWKISSQCANDLEHIIQVFEIPVTPGLRASVVFSLYSTVDLRIRASLARHGKTPYEGNAQEFRCEARHKHLFSLSHQFSKAHESIKLQIVILSQEFEPGEISMVCQMISSNTLLPTYGSPDTKLKPLVIGNSNESFQIQNMGSSLLGPYSRTQSAHFDETDAVAKYFSNNLEADAMVDVGAHIGGALGSFLNRGWKIWAFEPDHNNRAKLEERLSAHRYKANVNLDTRCVSNKSQSGVAFYQSEESTGISGLSAFRDTHKEAQRVDTVSLSDFFQGREMPEVDFLKIDTEGHDLFVLQGFPWERNRPKVIECEFEDLKTKPLGYTTKDMADFLVGKGYTVYVSEWHPILKYGQRHDWHRLQKYPCELACPEAWGNLLAFSSPPDEAKLIESIKSVLKFFPSARSGQQASANGNAFLPRQVHEHTAQRPEEQIHLKPNSFAQANKLYREGKFAEAHQIYLALQQAYPELPIYQTNAQMALRRLAHKSTQ